MEVTKTGVKQHICGTHNAFHKVKVTKTGLEHFICGAPHNFVVSINHSTKRFCQIALHQTTTFVDLWTFHRQDFKILKSEKEEPSGPNIVLGPWA